MTKEKTTITIEKILDKQTSTGKAYKVLRTNGDGYFLWNTKWLAEKQIKEGDSVELTHSGGDFPKIIAMEKRAEAAIPAAKESNGVQVFSTYHKLQAKESAALAASNFFQGRDVEPELMIALSRKIYLWLLEPDFDDEEN